MAVKDSFDPTMDLSHAKNKGEPAGAVTPGSIERYPADVLKLDGTSNLGTPTTNVEIPGAGEKSLNASGVQRQAGLVDTFSGDSV